MGGSVAVEVAWALPGIVRHLILAEPNLDAGGGEFSRAIAVMPEQVYVTCGHHQTINKALADGNIVWAHSLAVASPIAVHRSAKSLTEGSCVSWRDSLMSLRCLRAVVAGDNSTFTNELDRLASQGIATKIIDNSSHFMIVDNPSTVARAINELTV